MTREEAQACLGRSIALLYVAGEMCAQITDCPAVPDTIKHITDHLQEAHAHLTDEQMIELSSGAVEIATAFSEGKRILITEDKLS